MFYTIYKELCEEKKIKPSRVAEEIGISRAAVTNWKKNGYTPQGDVLQKIADYFNVSIDYLLGKTNIKKAPTNSEGETELQKIAAEIDNIKGSGVILHANGKYQKALRIPEDKMPLVEMFVKELTKDEKDK